VTAREPLADLADRLELRDGLVDGEGERVGDREPSVADLERLAAVAAAAARSQVDEHVGQEVHLVGACTPSPWQDRSARP
jgi:hypothetical protein